jgi:hypothetical protein
MRIARSRISGVKVFWVRFFLLTAPFSQRLQPKTNPGLFICPLQIFVRRSSIDAVKLLIQYQHATLEIPEPLGDTSKLLLEL